MNLFALAVNAETINANIQPVVAAVVGQVVLGAVYFSIAVSGPWMRAIALDKGVTHVDFIVQRYSMALCLLSSIAAGAIRAVTVLVLAALARPHLPGFGGDCQCWLYLAVGVAAWAVSRAPGQSNFWCQRPWSFIVLTSFGDLLNFLGAALILACWR